ncbi:anti-sigma regulatory factor (Ser/Thr protein kinase) [Kitasatospora sp. MAA19]|nr:anti-sigma regulatory factor (Ser/Thr protein kinase) [Kitasatospora sp. MAA19]
MNQCRANREPPARRREWSSCSGRGLSREATSSHTGSCFRLVSREATPPFTEEEISLTTAEINERPTGALAEDVLSHWVSGRPLSFRLPSLGRAVPIARQLAGLWLDAEDVRANHARDAALLVISELVTNALEHSDSAHITGWLRRTADRLLLEVRDQGKTSSVPRLHRATPDEDHGRGLALVAGYSQEWGMRLSMDGSCSVWAAVPLSSRSTAAW